jgi:hypothetical protein
MTTDLWTYDNIVVKTVDIISLDTTTVDIMTVNIVNLDKLIYYQNDYRRETEWA